MTPPSVYLGGVYVYPTVGGGVPLPWNRRDGKKMEKWQKNGKISKKVAKWQKNGKMAKKWQNFQYLIKYNLTKNGKILDNIL